MPQRAPKPCSKAGCGALAYGRYCTDHEYLAEEDERARKAVLDSRRGNSAARGYTWRWRRYSNAYLRAHPLCVMCETEGITRVATEVDHKKPHRGDMQLFWDTDNHQGLCKPHHSRKTATEDSNFAGGGHPPAQAG